VRNHLEAIWHPTAEFTFGMLRRSAAQNVCPARQPDALGVRDLRAISYRARISRGAIRSQAVRERSCRTRRSSTSPRGNPRSVQIRGSSNGARARAGAIGHLSRRVRGRSRTNKQGRSRRREARVAEALTLDPDAANPLAFDGTCCADGAALGGFCACRRRRRGPSAGTSPPRGLRGPRFDGTVQQGLNDHGSCLPAARALLDDAWSARDRRVWDIHRSSCGHWRLGALP
jgi:hypothetical protein